MVHYITFGYKLQQEFVILSSRIIDKLIRTAANHLPIHPRSGEICKNILDFGHLFRYTGIINYI